jgi:glycosyltransferase involved in cell wall biosynthesis
VSGGSLALSFIVPAHDEAKLIARTVASLHAAARAVGVAHEVVVVDDASSDRTGDIARAHGARVIRIEARHIAASRNAGGRAARGRFLVFIDADTLATPPALRAALDAMARGAVGGGCVPRFDGRVPGYARALMLALTALARATSTVGGCFIFCTREAFAATGGFDERLYAAEDVAMVAALKRLGRFVVPRPHVITSGRKVRDFSPRELLAPVGAILRSGGRSLRQREGLELWYKRR